MKKNKKGFTLAEILVTLGVIGVIASMTVPTMVQDIQDAQFKTSYKKIYAELSQAAVSIARDNAGTFVGVLNSGDHNGLNNLFANKMNSISKCNQGEAVGICWHAESGTNYRWKWASGSLISGWGWHGAPGIALNNGAIAAMLLYSNTCNDTSFGIPVCGSIVLDINGFREPNRFGKDIYYLYITAHGIKPRGIQGDLWTADCTPNSGGGQGCAARYLYQ